MNGWAVTALFIIAYDVCQIRKGEETMSACFKRASTKPPGKASCALAWGLLTYHLFGKKELHVRRTRPR